MKIGTDIIQISRLERSLEKFGDRFKEKYLTSTEIAKTKKIESLAGLWAAKEAVAKALGCGIGKDLSFHDIQISKDSRGAPQLSLSSKAQEKHQIMESSLSISHDGGFAIAVAVITAKSPK
ncbi:MAG: holo-ACP synthase [Campylobacterota bacterium]|nr:holo-ACP synthase [Campylobacterota bacterium]